MNINEALATLNSFDDDTLLGQSEGCFNYHGKVVAHYEWEDRDKNVFTIAYVPDDFSEKITSEIAKNTFRKHE